MRLRQINATGKSLRAREVVSSEWCGSDVRFAPVSGHAPAAMQDGAKGQEEISESHDGACRHDLIND